MEDIAQERANELAAQVSDTMNVIIASRQGQLSAPLSFQIEMEGEDEAEALGNARFVASEIEDGGYSVEIDTIEEMESFEDDHVRFRYELRVSNEE